MLRWTSEFFIVLTPLLVFGAHSQINSSHFAESPSDYNLTRSISYRVCHWLRLMKWDDHFKISFWLLLTCLPFFEAGKAKILTTMSIFIQVMFKSVICFVFVKNCKLSYWVTLSGSISKIQTSLFVMNATHNKYHTC